MAERAGKLLVYDIGGTNMRVALFRDVVLGEVQVAKTPKNASEGMDVFRSLAEAACGEDAPEALCGGIAGVLEVDRSKLFSSAHLPLWATYPLQEELGKMYGVSVMLENDSALACLGEAHEGAGKGERIVSYLTVSTGIGGARVVDGKLDAHAVGFEPGHQVIDTNGVHDPERGELERYVSGTAVRERFGIEPRAFEDEEKRAALARVLAHGVHNVIVHWSPDIIVFGGSMITGKNSYSLESVRAELAKTLDFFPLLPKFAIAELGAASALHGARIFWEQQQ